MPQYTDYIDRLRNTLIVVDLNFEVWWTYKNEDTRSRFINVMNQYSIFFQTSIHAHFVATVVGLYRLYETRSDAVSIPRVLHRLRAEKVVPEGALQSLSARSKQAKTIWVRVAILRNEVFGHLAIDTTIEEAFRKAALTPNDLAELIIQTKALLNDLTRILERSCHAFNLNRESGEDVVRMLTDLSAYHKRVWHR
jgi:hypothetical protein